MAEALKHQDLLDSEAIRQLSRVEMVATRFVEGFLSGMHRSPFKGGIERSKTAYRILHLFRTNRRW